MPDEYEQRRPFQEDGHLAVPQEPRTGGVRGIPLRFNVEWGVYYRPGESEATHVAFTIAQAEALIDPNDPAVRARVRHEIVIELHGSEAWEGTYEDAVHVADAVLDALRSKP